MITVDNKLPQNDHEEHFPLEGILAAAVLWSCILLELVDGSPDKQNVDLEILAKSVNLVQGLLAMGSSLLLGGADQKTAALVWWVLGKNPHSQNASGLYTFNN